MTAMLSTFQPTWISAPGETITELMEELGLSFKLFADKVGADLDYTRGLIDGSSEITTEVAQKLEIIFDVSATFWKNRDIQYRRDIQRLNGDVTAEKNWLSEIPATEMTKLGWISAKANHVEKVRECLRFFGVTNLEAWRETFENLTSTVAFRTTSTFDSSTGSVAAWLRRGEIESESIRCNKWDKEQFIATIPNMRLLSREKDPTVFIPKLRQICAASGVAIVIVRAPKGCHASGATRFINDTKAILQLSFRYLSDDHFWFTFFHEAGHLILHNHAKMYLETDQKTSGKEEDEANDFSATTLIPIEHRERLSSLGSDAKKVMRYARDIGVSPGIVAGQLQHAGIIPRNYLNNLKTRYSWD